MKCLERINELRIHVVQNCATKVELGDLRREIHHLIDRVGQLLDRFPNADVEVSARVQELGRQPYTARKWLIKYQDRVLFGTDGSPDRDVERIWTPHWRFFETDDEHFDHPAQMLSPLGAPLQGRWRIYGVFLPDDVLRKIYYRNALKYLPSLRAPIEKQLNR